MSEAQWLAIAIGNTNIKAAVFQQSECMAEYTYLHTELSSLEASLSPRSYSQIAIASVVPDLITPWHGLPQTLSIETSMIPIAGIYATMGVDRALAAWGAGLTYGYPVLSIDLGTAITLTGLDSTAALVGGAILPGLQSQFHALRANGALLPEVSISTQLPPRWATDTVAAIQSGVIYGVIASLQAFIQDWLLAYPDSKIAITGGDGKSIAPYLEASIVLDPRLIFWGIRGIWETQIAHTRI